MNRRSTLALTTTTLLCLAVALPSGDALAQQKQQASFTASAENSKYTQQLNVDVGDVPNHMVRIFDLHRTYPNNAPVINGLKLGDKVIAEGLQRVRPGQPVAPGPASTLIESSMKAAAGDDRTQTHGGAVQPAGKTP